jgi:pyroglutamyl-peptidase
MKILVTAFEPFNKEKVNSSEEVLKQVKENENITKMVLPVVFGKCFSKVYEKMDKDRFDYIIMLGESGGRTSISIERIAVNLQDARIPDNTGNKPHEEKIFPDGATAYFTNVNIKAAEKELNKAEIPVQISNSAGLYVCNNLFYGVMYRINKENLKTKAAFVHTPFLEKQVINKPHIPAIALQSAVKAVETLLSLAQKGKL